MNTRETKLRAWVFGAVIKRMIKWEDIDAIEFCNDKLWYNNGKYVLLGNVELLWFTGTKDKTQNDVYEGDILECIYQGKLHYRMVYWLNDIGGYMTINVHFDDDMTFGLGWLTSNGTITVIGNRCQHPELIKISLPL